MQKATPWLVCAAVVAYAGAISSAFASVEVDPGGSWGAPLSAGDLVRFVDIEGRQAVDFLCYGALDTRDRYNAANTMKMAQNIFINAGTILYGEYATALMKVVASSCPQKYNPACGYNPSAVRVETYARQRAHRGR